MLRGLLYLLVGAFVLVVALYVVKLVIVMLGLPPDIAQFTLIVIGLIGLVGLIYLLVRVFRGGDPWTLSGGP